MSRLDGKVVWVTGAGSGIGEAAAVALAGAGARVVLTGRRREPLEGVAARIGAAAEVEPGDVTASADVGRIAAAIGGRHGRLDVLVANAGVNVTERDWARLTPAAAEAVLDGNLTGPFLCALAALPIMRAQGGGGLLVHTASMAGRVVSLLSGPAYTAAKHGLVAMSHSINMQECVNGIRSCVVLPGEVATPILDSRPVPVGEEDKARMLRPEDVADLILYVACLPPHVLVNEVMITPTWNRAYVREVRRAGL